MLIDGSLLPDIPVTLRALFRGGSRCGSSRFDELGSLVACMVDDLKSGIHQLDPVCSEIPGGTCQIQQQLHASFVQFRDEIGKVRIGSVSRVDLCT